MLYQVTINVIKFLRLQFVLKFVLNHQGASFPRMEMVK